MNMTRLAYLLAGFILAALALSGCSIGDGRTVHGSGNVVEETRVVSGVTGVNLATIGDLSIEVGDTESFRIEAQDNLMEYIETEVRNGQLRIETQDNVNLRSTRPINYYLTVTGLDTIVISSVGGIEAPDLEAGRFSITINSTGNLEMGDLEADTLTVNISSTGDVTMGMLNAKTLEVNINITISSSGKYTAQDLASDEAQVRLNSSGSATIWVRSQLKANLSSSGDLRYRGNPTVDATTDSSGGVIQIGE